MSSENTEFGDFIEFSIKKKFGIIKLNRVRRGNAITIEMAKNLKKAIEFCQNSEKIRGIILTGNGTSFTTGMDIDEIDGSDHIAVKEYEKTAASIQKLCYYGKPVICAINGKAMGDGYGVLIPGHGIVVAGETLAQTLVSTVYLEAQAKKLYHASVLGNIPEDYLRLNTTPPKATLDGDSMQWYLAKLKEKNLYPEFLR